MKHAGAEALDRLEDLLTELRSLAGLKEKSRGVFYWRSKAFVHFHDDPSGLYADLRIDEDFVRLPVTTKPERKAFIAAVRKQLQQAG
jgi:hypothetical protein